MRGSLRRVISVAAATGLAVGVLTIGPAAGAADSTQTCSGTTNAPGVLAGTYPGDVVIQGLCAVNGGAAVVRGDLTISERSGLVAAFALNDAAGSGSSSLTVSGDVRVEHRGVLVMGCTPVSFPCLDDPHQRHPSLESHDFVSGSLLSLHGLGVLVHNSTIHGDVDEGGGGGGVNCDPVGVFKLFQSPAYSAYEDTRVDGDVRIHGNRSCWMGVNRVRAHGDVLITNNQLADPDAIEILSNRISGDLVCHGDSMTWDTVDLSETGLYPRGPEPNTVHGDRVGQCVLSSPTDPTDPPGPGPF